MIKFCLSLLALLAILAGILSGPFSELLFTPNLIGDKTIFTDCIVKNVDGTLTNEVIEIHQVDHGFKLVEAETMMGAFYGLGFIHAMDRLWQIDLYRRIANGRSAELFGTETLEIDKYMRLKGLNRLIQYQWSLMDEEEHALYENYAAGVNKAYENRKILPIEYWTLWTDFESYTPQDAMSMQMILTTACTGDWH